ncbi:MAG TPA: hypothetical protein VFU12_08880 [Glycomyces sp.]|nr:hypothetical protein [Glycomyces sp.]
MAQSTTSTSGKIWRTVLTGAAVIPIAVLAAAPAVGAAVTEASGPADAEQEPIQAPVEVPAEVPDQTQALRDLDSCLTELEALVGEAPAPAPAAPAPGVGAAEQLPVEVPDQAPVEVPAEVPDLVSLVDTCQALLETAQGTAPAAEPAPQELPAG